MYCGEQRSFLFLGRELLTPFSVWLVMPERGYELFKYSTVYWTEYSIVQHRIDYRHRTSTLYTVLLQ